MSITYDKKFLKWYGNLDKNKIRKEAFRQGLFSAVWNLVMFYFIYLILGNNEIDFFWFLLIIFFGLLSFIFHYFLWIWNIRGQKKTYDESIKYWKEHDPNYLDGIIDIN